MTEFAAGTSPGADGYCECPSPCAMSRVGVSSLGCRAAPPVTLPAAEPPDEAIPPTPTRRWRQAWRWISGALAITFMLGAIVLAWPQDRGGQFRLVVVSGTSMEPTYHTADMLIAKKSSDYRVGDVVVYTAYVEGRPVGRVVHRLVEQQPDGTYLTQGDNKDYPDPWSVRPEWIEGKVAIAIPRGFIIIYILRNPIFLAVMSGLLLTAALWPRSTAPEATDADLASDSPLPASGTDDSPTPAGSAWQPGD